jgi:hypothetical protein
MLTKQTRDVIEAIVKLVALMTFIFGVFKYFDANYLASRRLALERIQKYIDDYSSGSVSTDMKVVSDFWRRKIPSAVLRDSNISQNDMRHIFTFIIAPDPDYKPYEAALNRVIVHYDLVAFCAEKGLCDSDIVRSFYCNEYRQIKPILTITLDAYDLEGIQMAQEGKDYFNEHCKNSSNYHR